MKTILITGAQRRDGIGYQIASQISKYAEHVFLTARELLEAEDAARSIGSNVHGLALDVSKPESIAALPAAIEKFTPSLDVLVNNAGLLFDMRIGVLEIKADMFTQTFVVNSIAPVLLAQTLLPLLKASSAPRIINVSSAAGQLSDGELSSWAPAYSASKAALNALTQQLASALPNFAVNSVCPGWCQTRMGGKQAPRSPAQGADTIVWLAREAPQNLTGKFLRDRVEIAW